MIVSIAGATAEEFVGAGRRLDGVPGIAALELNISCPNVSHGVDLGTDPDDLPRRGGGVREATSLPVIAKLTPNVTDIVAIARGAADGGADAVTLINTLQGMAVDWRRRRPLLGNVVGGLSGPAIKPVALRCVHQVHRAVGIPIIGVGGIMTIDDCMEFFVAGASAVQIGTASFAEPVDVRPAARRPAGSGRRGGRRRVSPTWSARLGPRPRGSPARPPRNLRRCPTDAIRQPTAPASPPAPSPASSRPAGFTGATTSGRSGNTSSSSRAATQAAAEAYYFIADLHALTTVRDPAVLRGFVRDAALDLVALGLDPERAVLFVQSDVPEVTELTWLLMTVAPMGLLERCHAYKDKKTRGLPADAGLFTYPVLMAADILAYDATVVPVGEDQVQHIEVCRDLAGTFNHLYGEVFTLPKPRLVEGGAKVPGTDGQKMSKSYENTIEVFEEPPALKKKIMRITTDSRPMEEPKEPEGDHLYQLYSLFAAAADRQAMADLYRRGGFGYGEIKKKLLDGGRRSSSPTPGPGGRSWRPTRTGSRRSSPPAPPRPAARRARCSPGPGGPAGSTAPRRPLRGGKKR